MTKKAIAINTNKDRLQALLKDPNNLIESQIILLNELSIRLVKEKDPIKKDEIRKDLKAITIATNSIKNIAVKKTDRA